MDLGHLFLLVNRFKHAAADLDSTWHQCNNLNILYNITFTDKKLANIITAINIFKIHFLKSISLSSAAALLSSFYYVLSDQF